MCGSSSYREIFRSLRPTRAAATGRHTEDLFGKAGRIVRCRTCGLVRQLDPPVASYAEAEEDTEYLIEEAGIRRTFREVVQRVERYRPPPGRLLDAGCGPGFLLDEAVARGWNVQGVEPADWAISEAKSRGHDVTKGTLESVPLDRGSFNAIVATDVIEHVPDPVAFARRMHELLAPGGVVFIATPDVSSGVARVLRRLWWSVIPNHLWFFSPKTLEAVFSKAGFEPLVTTTHPKTFSLTYYAGRFGGYSKVLGSRLRGLSRVFGGRNRLVTPNFRDRIAFLAQKL